MMAQGSSRKTGFTALLSRGARKGRRYILWVSLIDSRGIKVAEHNIYLNDRVDDPEAVNRALAVNDEPIVRRFVDDFFPRLKLDVRIIQFACIL